MPRGGVDLDQAWWSNFKPLKPSIGRSPRAVLRQPPISSLPHPMWPGSTLEFHRCRRQHRLADHEIVRASTE
jgi:hypothetical protein